jgi:hypothetical protein
VSITGGAIRFAVAEPEASPTTFFEALCPPATLHKFEAEPVVDLPIKVTGINCLVELEFLVWS